MIRVAAIDDDRMLLGGLAVWLRDADGIELVATAATVTELLENPPEADVVLLDLRLGDGTRPTDNVRALVGAGFRVLVVSTAPEYSHVVDTVGAGAAGYLTKDNDLAVLADAVRQVAAGETAYSRELVFSWVSDRRAGRPELSPQEQAVLLAYASGATLDTAARKAGIQPGTAKKYLERVKNKYRAAGRVADTKLQLADRIREDNVPDP